MREVKISAQVKDLLNRGVILPCPFSVEVDPSVNPKRIAAGVIIHTGCKVTGANTSIGPGSEIGKEAPATVEDCQLGHKVALKGGFYSGATFLDGASMGSAAHVRPGTLLEEEASGAHAVGFKQTIFLSFVTAGSLINFCDALMAGGTGLRNHSEIGSSYIHFNFTPHQDKATASLIGDVPRGVFLDQPPIFLGGQGGLVGPARIAYGTVIPAGIICRQDILEEKRVYAAPSFSPENRTFAAGVYRSIHRVVRNNLTYIGNLWALKAWYQDIRVRTMSTDAYHRACREGALEKIECGLNERVVRLQELAGKMHESLKRVRSEAGEDMPPEIQAQQQALIDRWQEMEMQLRAGPRAGLGSANRDILLREWEQTNPAEGHVPAVRGLSRAARKAGAAWLQEIADSAVSIWAQP